ncbi:MAG: CHASE2 domain-containing protein [Spirochaetales bacterium]|nr:CHASE2 domain-containing protein [Spirochaetales bacterium]
MRKRLVEFLIPAIVLAIFAGLNFVPFFQTAEKRVYDLFLRIRPAVEQRDDILFMDVDDNAIANVGLWPWSRDYMARGLILLREFDSSYVTFDIEYVDPSPQAVNARYLQQDLPRDLDAEFSFVQDSIYGLFDALAQGQISIAEAGDFIDDLSVLTEDVKANLITAVTNVVRDNDQFLGQAAGFHGLSFFTVNQLRELEPLSDAERAKRDQLILYVEDAVNIDEIDVVDASKVQTGADLRPTIQPVLSHAGGAGFPNVVVDDDGVRRRIDLVTETNGTYYAQLVTAPLLDWLGQPTVRVDRNQITLQDARLPGSPITTDIHIPLATDGRMLINWPKATFLESFRHLSYWRLVYHWEVEEEIVDRLRAMDEANFLFFYEGGDQLLPLYDFAESLKDDVLAGGDRAQIDDWREYRQIFFEEAGAFLAGTAEEDLIAELDYAINSGELQPEDAETYQIIKDEARAIFAETRERYDLFMENRQVLQDEVAGSFVIIGWTGTSTTDIGVNPFEHEYMNVGTHAAVVNTILNENFLDDLPWWIPFAGSVVFVFLTTLIIRRLKEKPVRSLLVGFGALLLIAAVGVVLFVTTGIYMNILTPLLSVFLTFIVLTIMNFLTTNKDKQFIRSAFSHYLSPDVINEVLSDPAKLGLGGERKNISAIFTDVQGFSTISEAISPEKLVHLLNRYLTEMCDIILDGRGTIDKFEGDAIIAFFGAPVEMDDHQIQACRAAIQMKKLEERLNQEFLDDELSPTPLLTRIGVNSGDMVVGNMGTDTRMDYTMMGHNVNLAARLEGVNKQYGTWILVSEQTYDKTGRAFSVRKLDRVRVMGITEPVRLYELIDLREEVDGDQNLIDKLRTFNAGLTAFEEKAWGEAEKNFAVVLNEYPEDGPAKYYLDRSRKFKKTPPSPDWDGVFNLTKK